LPEAETTEVPVVVLAVSLLRPTRCVPSDIHSTITVAFDLSPTSTGVEKREFRDTLNVPIPCTCAQVGRELALSASMLCATRRGKPRWPANASTRCRGL
jgi:hypothetical protein